MHQFPTFKIIFSHATYSRMECPLLCKRRFTYLRLSANLQQLLRNVKSIVELTVIDGLGFKNLCHFAQNTTQTTANVDSMYVYN